MQSPQEPTPPPRSRLVEFSRSCTLRLRRGASAAQSSRRRISSFPVNLSARVVSIASASPFPQFFEGF